MEEFVENNPFDSLNSEEITTPDFGVTEADSTTPLSVVNFKPMEENEIICQISPAKFDSLLKVLGVLVSDKSSNDSLIIKESNITQNISGAIISSNVEEIFEGKKIDLQIINPKKYLKLFKTFRNNNDIFILTNQRVINIDQRGFFSRRVAETELENIQNVSYEIKGPIKSILNFGDVMISTAGNTVGLALANVENPHFVQEKIVELQKKSKIKPPSNDRVLR